jgi:hypothetical protein
MNRSAAEILRANNTGPAKASRETILRTMSSVDISYRAPSRMR